MMTVFAWDMIHRGSMSRPARFFGILGLSHAAVPVAMMPLQSGRSDSSLTLPHRPLAQCIEMAI
jgi:hypothetical protein